MSKRVLMFSFYQIVVWVSDSDLLYLVADADTSWCRTWSRGATFSRSTDTSDRCIVSYRRQCACSPAYLCVCFFVFRSAGALCCTSNTLRVRCSVHFTWLQSTTAAAPVWPPPCHWLCPHMPSSISKILELPCPCFCVSFIHN